MVSRVMLCLLFCTTSLLAQDLRINEVMSKNYSDFLDSNGDDSDWIELYNAGSAEILLGDYFLSDAESNLLKWDLPNVSLLAGEHIVFFANSSAETNSYNTNFSIASGGETIYLSDVNALIDSLEVPSLFANESFGIDSTGGTTVYRIASPGESNSLGVEEFRVYFSHDAGFYETEFTLELNTKDTEVEIRYTLDGRDPSLSATLYDEGLSMTTRDDDPNVYSSYIMHPVDDFIPDTEVQKCNVVCAQVYKNGVAVGRVYRKTFFVDALGAGRYQMPVVSIISEPDNFFDPDSGMMVPGPAGYENIWAANYWQDWESPAHFEWFEEGELLYQSNVGIKMHGGDSRNKVQKPFKVFAKKEFGTKKFEMPFFENTDRSKWDDLVLKSITARANKCGFNDELAYDIVQSNVDWKTDGSAYRYFILFIDGEYWGIYSLREKLNEDFIEEYYDIPESSLDLFESVEVEPEGILNGNALDFEQLIADMQALDMEDSLSVAFLESRIDLDNFLDYFIMETYANNFDWVTHNMLLFKNRDDPLSRWTFLLWDLDFGFHHYRKPELLRLLNYQGEYQDELIEPYEYNLAFFFNKIFESDIMKQRLVDRYFYHCEHSFCAPDLEVMIDVHEQRLLPEIEEHIHRYDSVLSDLDDWENEIARIREYVRKRPENVIQQLNLAFEENLTLIPCFEEIIDTTEVDTVSSSIAPILEPTFVQLEAVWINYYSLSGDLVARFEGKPNELDQLKNTNLPSGIYIARYQIGDEVFGRKLFIE